MLINTWKRSSALKQSIAHYASCNGVAAIHVVWSDSDPPSESLKSHLEKMVFSMSRAAQKPNFRFGISQEEDLNNRFKPIEGLTNDAVFSVDDDAIVSCPTLDFAFTVWQSAPNAMVGFTPRMHWLDKEVSILGLSGASVLNILDKSMLFDCVFECLIYVFVWIQIKTEEWHGEL